MDPSIRARVVAIRDEMQRTFIERDDAIECLMLSCVTQNHPLLLGPPGGAKSALLNALTSCIDGARIFSTLLTKFSTEDEICGPVKFSALKLDKFERATDGHFAGVEVAFLDETFKSNSAVLNSLLTGMNERTYKGAKIPLRMMCGASNEMPEEEGLSAMFDRFLLRDVVAYIESDTDFAKYLRASAPDAVGGTATAKPFAAPEKITIAEWDAIAVDIRTVAIPTRIIEEVVRLKQALKVDGIIVSDRRWRQLLTVLQAAAWLDGCDAVELDHLHALRFGLWSKPDERERVNAVLRTIDNGPVGECMVIIDDAMRAFNARPSDPARLYEETPKLMATLTDAGKRVKQYSGLSKRATAKIAKAMAALGAAHAELKDVMVKRYTL